MKYFACLLLLILPFSVTAQEVTTQTAFVVFPADCNSNPPAAFGGKLMAEMDRAAAIAVRRFLYKSPTGAKDAVTVAVENVQFKAAARVKDLLLLKAVVREAGRTSIKVDVTIERETREGCEVVTTGRFVFVAVDLTTGKSLPHGIELRGE